MCLPNIYSTAKKRGHDKRDKDVPPRSKRSAMCPIKARRWRRLRHQPEQSSHSTSIVVRWCSQEKNQSVQKALKRRKKAPSAVASLTPADADRTAVEPSRSARKFQLRLARGRPRGSNAQRQHQPGRQPIDSAPSTHAPADAKSACQQIPNSIRQERSYRPSPPRR